MHSYRMAGQRGFTLFTALVAFILIVLAMLLVQSMVSTERSTSEIISDVAEQEEMQAIADLSRADALQVFNFGIRYTIEEFSTKDDNPKDGRPENDYIMFPSDAGSWSTLKQDFVADRFGVGEDAKGNQFALLAARHLISLLERSDDARGFSIELSNPDEAAMAEILRTTFDEQKNRGEGEFFEIVNCEPASGTHYEDCTGSFYITMDLSEGAMSDAQYEKFPQVRVRNNITGRVLQEPILPRGKFRIYIPLRMFKALAGAREASEIVFSDSLANSLPQDKRRAEDYIKDELESGMRIIGGEYDGFRLADYDVLAISTGSGTQDDPYSLQRFEATLYFEDNNENYKVSSRGTDEKGGPNIYAVRLVRLFS